MTAIRNVLFVMCDQLVDRTSGRVHTYYDGPETTHVSFADPYCPTMREFAIIESTIFGCPSVVTSMTYTRSAMVER